MGLLPCSRRPLVVVLIIVILILVALLMALIVPAVLMVLIGGISIVISPEASLVSTMYAMRVVQTYDSS